jgi:hypothetical protein
MFRKLTIPILATVLLSCNNPVTIKTSNDTIVTNQESKEIQTKPQRQILIKELKGLQTIFASKDKEKIADVFSFPASDTALAIYIDDSIYLEQVRKNNDMTSRDMFLEFFPKIYQSLQIEGINQLFKYINPNALIQKDTLQHEAHIKAEPCYKILQHHS